MRPRRQRGEALDHAVDAGAALHHPLKHLGRVRIAELLVEQRASEERYRRFLERIQDGVVIIDDGRIAYANRVFADMVGATPERLLGRDFRDLVPPEDRAELQERYERWLQSESVSWTSL